MGKISLTIDGRTVEAESGATVLQAARGAGIGIPTLCDHKDLSPYGACRMCIVEIEGVRGLPTSCTTPAAPGMVVKTQTDELRTQRNRTLELMLSGHPNSCLVCNDRELCEKYRPRPTKAGAGTRCGCCSNRDDCSLRSMALLAGDRELNLPTLYSALHVEKDDPFMDRDYNLCILCGKCWRICEKIHGKPAISIINRGKKARLGTAFLKNHTESGCTFCGSCIDICPTGSLTDRFARWYGKPDGETASTCTLCPEGCSLFVTTKGNRVTATRMTAFDAESSLCALGRFAYAQIVESTDRIQRPVVKEDDDQIPSDWETAIRAAADILSKYRGATAFIADGSSTREDRFLVEKLARTVEGTFIPVPAGAALNPEQLETLRNAVASGQVKAIFTAGDYLDEALLNGIERLIVADAVSSPASLRADVVFPVAVLSETSGTFKTSSGTVKTVLASTPPAGKSRPEWSIVRDVAQTMGLDGFDFASVENITPHIGDDPAPAPFDGNPRQNVSELPPRFRGKFVADIVGSLKALGLPSTPETAQEEVTEGGFTLLDRRQLSPNLVLLEIEAPEIAKYAKPGQFVIVMTKETSERTPFTLVDWNPEKGSITLVVEEVGRSSREVVALRKGDRIAHVSGPLGMPYPIENVGTVVLGGGCYGIGAIYPVARALKAAGNRVICAVEASARPLLYMEEEMKTVCDELFVVTKDGSSGVKGGIRDVFKGLVAAGTKVDRFIAIGCTFMMRIVSEATKPLGIPTFVALNPIMVDGTGMCGACRVSVGGATRFACVDGPIFNGHEVDWDELFSRRSAYAREEIEALPQAVQIGEGKEHHHAGTGCGCGRH